MRAVVAGAWNVFDAIAADRRTDVNAENPAGETPLMYLAIAGPTRARALIARGAQVNRLGWTPPHYAASRASWRWRNCCCSKAMVNAPGPRATPLMMAALSGSKPMVELLLKAGADVTTRYQGAERGRLGHHRQVDQAGRRAARADRAPGSGQGAARGRAASRIGG